MKDFLFRISLAFIFLFFAIPLKAENDLGTIYRSFLKIRVEITKSNNIDPHGLMKHEYNYATGFYINQNGLIATAAHVVNTASKLLANPIICTELSTGIQFSARIVHIDSKRDVALINSPFGGNENYIDLSNLPTIKKKESCFCIGVPNEVQDIKKILCIVGGVIDNPKENLNNFKTYPSRKNVILTDCPVSVGFSGGLITNSKLMPIGIIIGSVSENGKERCFGRNISDVVLNVENNGKTW